MDLTLRVTELFFSLQGESSRIGLPSVFLRLTGCPLRCHYCDTAYAFHGGEVMTLAAILTQIKQHPTSFVCVTGGEPLAQKNCWPLLRALCDEGLHVSLETSGAIDIGGLDPRVKRIVDLKTPSSGEVEKNCYDNVALLTAKDEVKFVIASRQDYEWAAALIADERLMETGADILFSPVFAVESSNAESNLATDALNPAALADWILADGLAVRMQLQLHKLIWGDEQGR